VRSRAFAIGTVPISTTWPVVDRDRVLAKLDEVDGYLHELRSVIPRDLEEYARIEKKRSCERLLQLAVEATIDACAMLVSGLRLGLPGEENDLFESWRAEASSRNG
jgi:uncharacterized protein YutE (UPF0331/DUF86 family)